MLLFITTTMLYEGHTLVVPYFYTQHGAWACLGMKVGATLWGDGRGAGTYGFDLTGRAGRWVEVEACMSGGRWIRTYKSWWVGRWQGMLEVGTSEWKLDQLCQVG